MSIRSETSKLVEAPNKSLCRSQRLGFWEREISEIRVLGKTKRGFLGLDDDEMWVLGLDKSTWVQGLEEERMAAEHIFRRFIVLIYLDAVTEYTFCCYTYNMYYVFVFDI